MMPRQRKIALAASSVVLVLVLAVCIAFGPVVRKKVADAGKRRHLVVEIGSVRPGFFAVVLKNVTVRPEGLEGVSVDLDDVRVELSGGFEVQSLLVRGGAVSIHGDPDELRRKWKELHREESNAAAPRAAKPVSAEGLSLEFEGLGMKATGQGLAFDRSVEDVRFRATELKVVEGSRSLALRGLSMTVRDGALRELSGESLEIVVGQKEAEEKAPAATSGGDEAVPPPLPAAVATPAKPTDPLYRLPDPHALRAKLGPLQSLAGRHLPDPCKMHINQVRVVVVTKESNVALGPGAILVERAGDRVRGTFHTEARDGTTPLSLLVEIPIGEGESRVELDGGPIPLAHLGMHDGDFGLEDVTHATLSGKARLLLSSAGDALTFDGRVAAKAVSYKNRRIALDTIRGVDLELSGRGVLGAASLQLDEASMALGDLRFRFRGAVDATPEFQSVALRFDVPLTSCQGMLDAAPVALVPVLKPARVAGTFALKGRLAFDTRRLDELVLDYEVDDKCRMVEVPVELARSRFLHPFTHTVVHPDGTLGEESTGPGSDNWTDLDHISPYMQIAVLTTEDGRFFRHHGFNHPAFKNSLVANLKARRFVRGASTITMQLAKNLFLSRDKTLGRKLEEIVLADYIEQIFTKEELMELYLNVIEFGPDVYGITAAAEHYYGRRPEEISAAESLFLSSVLPSPIKFHKLKERGEVPDGWLKHLQTLMRMAAKNGRLSKTELDTALGERVIFWKDTDPRPVPRPPVVNGRVDGRGDAEWEPVN